MEADLEVGAEVASKNNKQTAVINITRTNVVKNFIYELDVSYAATYIEVMVTKTTIKDVRAHCYCASLVRTLFIGHARATSFSSARTESKN